MPQGLGDGLLCRLSRWPGGGPPDVAAGARLHLLYWRHCQHARTAATSLEGSYLAGKMGLGEMTFANFLGFGWLADARGRYLDGIAQCEPIGASTTRSFSAFTVAHCAETHAQARREAWPGVNIFTTYVVAGGPQLAKASKDYGYMGDYERFAGKVKDYDFLVNDSAVLCVGDPEDCVAQIRRYQEAGVDKMVLRIDLQPHEQIMRSIELFGKEVIPKLRHKAF